MVILVVAALLFSRPAELIVGGEDPGVYINTGIHIARTGGLVIEDETMSAVPAEISRGRLYVLPESYLRFVDGSLFPGIYVIDAQAGRMVSQFFHLFPTAVAVLYGLGGLPLTLYTTPLFALASVFMLYLLGCQLADNSVGLFAAGFLGLNISQIWFARLPFSDVVLQFWLVSGLWTLSTLIDREQHGTRQVGLLAVVSGACFGMAHLTKLDSYVVPVIVGGYMGVMWFLGRFGRSQRLLFGTYLLLATHAMIHATVFSAYYVYVMFSQFTPLLTFAAVGTVLGVGVLVVASRYRSRLVKRLRSSSHYQAQVRTVFVAVVLLASLHLYFVRPMLADLGELTTQQIGDRGQIIQALSALAIEPEEHLHGGQPTRTFVEEGLPRMGWYLTPLGVWLGIAGFLLWVLARPDAKALPFLGTALIYSGIVFYKGAIRSDFYWAFKRYVPFVVPAFILLIGYVLWQLGRVEARHPIKILPIVLTAFLVVSFTVEDLNVLGDVEYEGAIEEITELNAVFPSGAVILYQTSPSVGGVGTPLRFIFGRTIYPVPVQQIESIPMQRIIKGWLDAGTPVYWVTPTGKEIETYGTLNKVAEQELTWRTRAISWEQLPKRRPQFRVLLQIFEFAEAELRVPGTVVDANLGNEISLLAYELGKTSVAPGEFLEIDLYWYARRPIEKNYTLFVHVLDDGIMRGQWDGPLLDGALPTSSWAPGIMVRQQLQVDIALDAPSGSYPLSVGLYEWPSITRLPILEEGGSVGDRLILSAIRVRGAD
jgi:4-amino-4-deoxy-L-arabinose transferase-like glycosyltransferase